MRNKKFELGPGEQIVRVEPAKWHPSKLDSAVGALILTDRRLVFIPNSGMSYLSPTLGLIVDTAAAGKSGVPKGKPRVDVERSSIRSVEVTKRQRIAVTDGNGKTHAFDVALPLDWQMNVAPRPPTARTLY